MVQICEQHKCNYWILDLPDNVHTICLDTGLLNFKYNPRKIKIIIHISFQSFLYILQPYPFYSIATVITLYTCKISF